MWDDRFHLRPEALHDPHRLALRLRMAALLNLVLSPFLAIFLAMYFFLRNAEHFYHHPGTIGARKWAPYASWKLRGLNELPHQLENRLNAAHPAATAYVAQFRSHAMTHVARLVAFVVGSFAALLLFLALIDEELLGERPCLSFPGGADVVASFATLRLSQTDATTTSHLALTTHAHPSG